MSLQLIEFKEIMLSEYNITAEGLKKISSFLKPIKLKKGDVFIKEDLKNDKIGILINGLMISTYISDKGNEEVSRIYAIENGNIIVSNHESFYYDSMSTENIKAIEETMLMKLSKDNLTKILEEYPEFEKIAKDISERSYISGIERIKQFQSYSGKERVANYYFKFKGLFNRINKQHLSSFLGINRNDFTKFLNEIIKE